MESVHTTRMYPKLNPTSTSLPIEHKICQTTKQTISIWNIPILWRTTQPKAITCDPIQQAIYLVSHNNKQLLLLKVAPCSHLALVHSFMVQQASSITVPLFLATTAQGITLFQIYLVRIQGHPLNPQLRDSHSLLWKVPIRQAVSSKSRHSQYLWNHWWFQKLKRSKLMLQERKHKMHLKMLSRQWPNFYWKTSLKVLFHSSRPVRWAPKHLGL